IHRRRLFLGADGQELMGEETLTGRGGKSFALRFHLHPAVQASVTQSSQAAFLKLPAHGGSVGGGWRLRIQGGDLSIADSVYLGQAGAVRRAQQLVVQGVIEGDTTQVKWALQKEGTKR
ncbi:MAG: heparinase II/III domain-containing protein, partial [Dongiaceae bacterium]